MLNAMRPTQNTVSVYLVVIACRGRDASTMISYGEGYCDASIVAGCDMSQPVTPVPTFFPKNRSCEISSERGPPSQHEVRDKSFVSDPRKVAGYGTHRSVPTDRLCAPPVHRTAR